MSIINFTFRNQSFGLDTKRGVLVGDDSVAKSHLTDAVAVYRENKTILGGEPWLPFDGVEITDPYHQPEQFAMCVFYLTQDTDDTFPDELDSYLQYAEPIKIESLTVLH